MTLHILIAYISGALHCDDLQESFFTLMATQMDAALTWLTQYSDAEGSIKSGMRSYSYADEGGYQPYDILDMLSLLYTLSGFCVVKVRLCDERFIKIFVALIKVLSPS